MPTQIMLMSAKPRRTSDRTPASLSAFDVQHLTNIIREDFNPLNAELNPICHLLALLAHPIFHVSRIRVIVSSLPESKADFSDTRETEWMD
jgi:hypothetical protein